MKYAIKFIFAVGALVGTVACSSTTQDPASDIDTAVTGEVANSIPLTLFDLESLITLDLQGISKDQIPKSLSDKGYSLKYLDTADGSYYLTFVPNTVTDYDTAGNYSFNDYLFKRIHSVVVHGEAGESNWVRYTFPISELHKIKASINQHADHGYEVKPSISYIEKYDATIPNESYRPLYPDRNYYDIRIYEDFAQLSIHD